MGGGGRLKGKVMRKKSILYLHNSKKCSNFATNLIGI